MSRVLVTGGTGFIGSAICWELERLGHDVVASDLDTTKQKANLEGFKGQIVNADASRPWKFEGHFDVVLHQAALTDPRYHDDQEIVEKNVSGFEHCLAFCREKGAQLVYASTAGLYGNGPTPMKEDQPKEVLTAYGKSKLMMDEMAESEGKRYPVVGLRYFNVFGMREAGKGRPASMIYHLGKQIRETGTARIFEFGEQKRDHIYVKDAVTANLKAWQSGKSGVFNVGTGRGTDFNELVEILNDVLKTKAKVEYFKMPYDPKTYQDNTVADVRLAEKTIGFKAAYALKDGITDYFRWLNWI